MKSLLSYKGDGPSEPTLDIINLFMKEWEEYTGGVGSFYYDSHLTQPSVWLRGDDYPSPYLYLGHDGNILGFDSDCLGVTGRGILFPDRCIGCLQELNLRSPTGIIRTTSPVELSEELGVEDVFNLLPHEYGYLKLKYGLHKDELFIPSAVRDLFTNGGRL